IRGRPPQVVASFAGWVRDFSRFHGLRHPETMGEGESGAFLTRLALERVEPLPPRSLRGPLGEQEKPPETRWQPASLTPGGGGGDLPVAQARIGLTSRPPTSVSRKSRPAWR